MAEFVANCPRCRARSITFDVKELHLVGILYEWAHVFEAFAICRHCQKSTTFLMEETTDHDTDMFRDASPLKVQDSLNNYFKSDKFISLKDQGTVVPPSTCQSRSRRCLAKVRPA
jgi:hypothetical protein